ncbi:MAG: hypothetical protein WCH07_09465 [Deltaproteobacteria bacterium]
MDNLLNSENVVMDIIKFQLGLKVEKIIESTEKSPDFLIQCGEYKYLIELKSKFTKKEFLKYRDEELLSGKIFEESNPAGRKIPISRVVESACKQLKKSRTKADFKLVWLYAKGHHPDFQIDDFESTLYGREYIADWGDNKPLIYCYYFGNSDFYFHRYILDGAIVSDDQEMKLCLNTLSPRYREFKKSKLRQSFRDGVIDPIEDEINGEAFSVDPEFDRNHGDVIDYLTKKYNLKRPMKMDMQQLSGTMCLPKK